MEQTTPQAAIDLGLDLGTAASREDRLAACSNEWRRLAELCDRSDGQIAASTLESMKLSPSVILASCANRKVYLERTFSLHGVVSESTTDDDSTVEWNRFELTPDKIMSSADSISGLRLFRGDDMIVVDQSCKRMEDLIEDSELDTHIILPYFRTVIESCYSGRGSCLRGIVASKLRKWPSLSAVLLAGLMGFDGITTGFVDQKYIAKAATVSDSGETWNLVDSDRVVSCFFDRCHMCNLRRSVFQKWSALQDKGPQGILASEVLGYLVGMWLSLGVCPNADLLAEADRNNVVWTAVNEKMKFFDMLEWDKVGEAVLRTDGLTSEIDRASVDGHVRLIELTLELDGPEFRTSFESAVQDLRSLLGDDDENIGEESNETSRLLQVEAKLRLRLVELRPSATLDDQIASIVRELRVVQPDVRCYAVAAARRATGWMSQCKGTQTTQYLSDLDAALKNNAGDSDSDEEREHTWGEVVDGRRDMGARDTNVPFRQSPPSRHRLRIGRNERTEVKYISENDRKSYRVYVQDRVLVEERCRSFLGNLPVLKDLTVEVGFGPAKVSATFTESIQRGASSASALLKAILTGQRPRAVFQFALDMLCSGEVDIRRGTGNSCFLTEAAFVDERGTVCNVLMAPWLVERLPWYTNKIGEVYLVWRQGEAAMKLKRKGTKRLCLEVVDDMDANGDCEKCRISTTRYLGSQSR
jgi:hypothetical protein